MLRPTALGPLLVLIATVVAIGPANASAELNAAEGDKALLFLLGSLAVPLVGLTVIGAVELSRRRKTTGQ